MFKNKLFDLTILGHDFYYSDGYICRKCNCTAHMSSHNNKVYQRANNYYQRLNWIDLLTCEENIIKNIIE